MARSRRAYEEAKYGPVTPAPRANTRPQQNIQTDTSLAQGRAPAFDEQRIRDFAAGADGANRTGFYVAAHLGNAFVADSDYEFDGGTVTASHEPLALFGSGVVGLDMGNGLSVEAELSYQSADLNKLTVTGSGSLAGISASTEDVQGSMSSLAIMANAKLALGRGGGFNPYVLAGLGLAQISVDGVQETGSASTIDDSGFAFAYQAGAGIMVPLTERASVDLGYRYFGTTDADMSFEGSDYTAGFSSHTVLVGLKYGL